MSGVRIRTLSARGVEALLKHRAEMARAVLHERLLYKAYYDEVVVSDLPLVVEITHKHPSVAALMDFDMMVRPIVQAMTLNGATKGIDYEIEEI